MTSRPVSVDLADRRSARTSHLAQTARNSVHAGRARPPPSCAPATRSSGSPGGPSVGVPQRHPSRPTSMPPVPAPRRARWSRRQTPAAAEVLDAGHQAVGEELAGSTRSAASPVNGSPTWTLGRLADSVPPEAASPNVALASTETPPMPSRPGRGAEQDHLVAAPAALAAATCRSPCRMTPTQSALTSGLPGVARIEVELCRRCWAGPRQLP